MLTKSNRIQFFYAKIAVRLIYFSSLIVKHLTGGTLNTANLPIVEGHGVLHCNLPDCSDDRAPKGAMAKAKHGDGLHSVAEHLVAEGVDAWGQKLQGNHDPGLLFSYVAKFHGINLYT